MVGLAEPMIVGGHQSGEGRLLLWPFLADRIDVVVCAARGAGCGSLRVRTVTVFAALPFTPSGSDRTKRHSYSVSGSRLRMLPENMFGAT